MVAILGANSVSGGYEVSNSLRFNDDDSAKLQRTPSSDGNKRVWTISTWLKRGKLGALQTFFGAGSSSPDTLIKLTPDDEFEISRYSGGYTWQVTSSNKLRDTSAWYHLVGAVDTTQGTASNRVKLYINGVQVSSFTYSSYPSQNFDTELNDTSRPTKLGTHPGDAQYYDGYMTETHFVDGSQLAPTDFGEFDDNAVWIPKKYSGTYGTNGFFMEFKQSGTGTNASGIGADTSGNDNHFAVSNLASTDITEDTCTNNFMTLNPLAKYPYNGTLSEGNVKFTGTNGGNEYYSTSTFAFTQGKWYSEFKLTSDTDGINIGIMKTDLFNSTSPHSTSSAYTFTRGTKRHDGASTSYGSTPSTNDILMMAVDMDNGKIWWGLNGTYFNSGDPASGSNEAFSSISGEFYVLVNDDYSVRVPVCLCNFGNPSFAISSGNNDGKYGNFEYAPPSGYYALCTKRLAEFG